MFQKDSLLIYDSVGVCRVEDVGLPAGIPVSDKTKQYYKLVPVYGPGTIYIPVDTKVFMRPIISREEAKVLIRKMPEIREDLCDSHNQKTLEDHYKASLQTHECESLVQLIKTVYMKEKNLEKTGKKTGKTDRQYMKRAKELLHEELSVALGIPMEEVEDYIDREVEDQE